MSLHKLSEIYHAFTSDDQFDIAWIDSVIAYVIQINLFHFGHDTEITAEQYTRISDIITSRYDPDFFSEYKIPTTKRSPEQYCGGDLVDELMGNEPDDKP